MDAFFAQAKEPFKTALSMVIAYGNALSMDWDKPYWAGFAVAFVSCAVALLLIGLFPQERWPFLLALSIYVGFCTDLMTGPKQQYFWNISGFVCVLICMNAGPDPVNAFETAILRAEETGLGILVYSLVTALLWPVSSRKDFSVVTSELALTQRQFCRVGLNRSVDGDPGQAPALKGQLLQAQTQLKKLPALMKEQMRERTGARDGVLE